MICLLYKTNKPYDKDYFKNQNTKMELAMEAVKNQGAILKTAPLNRLTYAA